MVREGIVQGDEDAKEQSMVPAVRFQAVSATT